MKGRDIIIYELSETKTGFNFRENQPGAGQGVCVCVCVCMCVCVYVSARTKAIDGWKSKLLKKVPPCLYLPCMVV